ncbi:MAG: biopolymer transporter ExbD [Novosphingobium sp.]|nr:biopolymer transporter ExbD [Novosphingobium sp.]
MRLRRKRRNMALLNITSLIDVVFMLLIFFMLTIDFSRFRMIGVDTPQQLEVVKDPTAAIVILLRKDGGFEYDGKPSTLDQIAARVRGILEVDPGRSFLIRPEQGVKMQDTIDMFQLTRDLGAYAVSFSPPDRNGEP